MKKEFIITSTNNIEGGEIIRYIDTICCNEVIGTNVFSDIAASFTDFFGGTSGTYRKKLNSLYEIVKKRLTEEAKSIGANAIIGYQIDFDEISGRNKQMLMVSASGTACYIKYKEQDISQQKSNNISNNSIEHEKLRRKVLSHISNDPYSIPKYQMEYMLEYPQTEFIEPLIKMYKTATINKNISDEFQTFIFRIFQLLPQESSLPILYKDFQEESIREIIINSNLFNPSLVLKAVKENHKKALDLLIADKDSYNEEDLSVMKEIISHYENLPNTGKIENVKGGLFEKDAEKFICENGHKNGKFKEFCEICMINIKGLSRGDIEKIDNLRKRIEIIEYLIEK